MAGLVGLSWLPGSEVGWLLVWLVAGRLVLLLVGWYGWLFSWVADWLVAGSLRADWVFGLLYVGVAGCLLVALVGVGMVNCWAAWLIRGVAGTWLLVGFLF